MQQLRSTRSTASSLIDQYVTDCRSVGDCLQVNIQRMTEDMRSMLSNYSRSIGKKGLFFQFCVEDTVLQDKL